MSVDMFLKIEGPPIKGESLDDKHKDDIDVIAWSWGMTNSGNAQVGGGAGAGKVHVNDLSITKWVDAATPELVLSTCNGQHHATVTLWVRKAGTTPIEYIKIVMTEVIITSWSTGGVHSDDRLVENINFNFREFTLDYIPQKTDGTPDAAKTVGWNIAGNVKK